jgi:hypothetical protein
MVPIFHYAEPTTDTQLPTLSAPTSRMTPRDKAIIRAVYEYRALTSPQVDGLLFPAIKGRKSTEPSSRCRHRLKLLARAEYILRAEQPSLLSEGSKPYVYFLAPRGAAYLAELQGLFTEQLDWRDREYQVGSIFLNHLLATNDVRIAITRAAHVRGLTLSIWRDDRTLKRDHAKEYVVLTGPQGGTKRASVIPDGYFVLETGAYRHHYFLEVDRRTETGVAKTWGQRDWARKIAAYIEYHRSGKYLERYGTRSMRVLTVTTGERRLTNLKAITEKIGGKSRFWFTTFDRISSEAVLTAQIWHVAGRTEPTSILEDARS